MNSHIAVSQRKVDIQDGKIAIRMNYLEALPLGERKETLLLIHGFPQSSFQFRLVMRPLANAGYHVVAPDCRGHGYSSRPIDTVDWTKRRLAHELHLFVTESLGIREKIHVIGHDIGGMIAHAYAAQFPEHVLSLVWGECPLPGTGYYEQSKHSSAHWHFDFHSHDPLTACELVAGKERMYIKHFFDKQASNQAPFIEGGLDFYASQYAMPGAMRCAFLTYRAFEEDAEDNRKWLADKGRIPIQSMVLSGEYSWAASVSGDMARELYSNVVEGVVDGCGHYLAEENPQGFVRSILDFLTTVAKN